VQGTTGTSPMAMAAKRELRAALSAVALLSVLLAASVLALMVRASYSQPEPNYKGVSLHEWLDSLVLDDSKTAQNAATEAVQSIGTNAIPFLLMRLSYRSPWWKRQVEHVGDALTPHDLSSQVFTRATAVAGFQALGHTAEPAIPALERLLRTKRIPESALALAAVGPQTCPLLARSLTNSDPAIRAFSAAAVGYLGDDGRPLTGTLLQLTKDPDKWVRVSAVRSLGNMPSKLLLQPLIESLRDPEPLVRKAAAEAIGRLGPSGADAIEPLRTASTDNSQYVRQEVQRALRAVSTSEQAK
jgi:HEAT repeat protein